MRTCVQPRSTCIRMPSRKFRRDSSACTSRFTAVMNLPFDPQILLRSVDRIRIFSVRIRNRCSVPVSANDTDQRRNLDCRIFRKSFKKKVRENIRILLRKDYVFYFRFSVYIILQVFSRTFSRIFFRSFSMELFDTNRRAVRGKMSRRDFPPSQDLPHGSYGSFPADNNEKIRRVSSPDFSEKNV